MSKIDQKSALRTLSVSSLCLCLSLSASSVFAMDPETEEKSPVAAASASAPSPHLTEKASAAPISRNFLPLSTEEQEAAQALLQTLKILVSSPEQKPLFDAIEKTRTSVDALLDKIDQLKSPPLPVAPAAENAKSTAVATTAPAADAPLATASSPDTEIQKLTTQIHASLATLTNSLKYSFGFVKTTFGYDRVSETFHKTTLAALNAQVFHYQKEALNHQAGAPLHQENTKLSEFFEEAHKTLTSRYDTITKDNDHFLSYFKFGRNPTAYALQKAWEDLVVITLSPSNFHLYASMMDLLDKTQTRLGLLQTGKSLIEGDDGLKYGLYDRNYIGAYLTEYKNSSASSVPTS